MGPSISISENWINETVNQTFDSEMRQTVDAKASANCSNIQSVENVQCCKIVFDTQTCEASAINEVVTGGQFDSVVIQETKQQLEQEAESKNEGLYLGVLQYSEASSVTNRFTTIAQSTKQIFETDCSKEVTGLNSQTVKDTNCGCGDQSAEARGVDIQFASQTQTLSATGTCVATAVGTSQAAQTLLQMTRQSASATNEGVDLFALFLAMIGPLMIFIIAPIGFKILTSPRKKVPNTPEGAALKTGTNIAAFLLVTIVLLLLTYIICAALLDWPPLPNRSGLLNLDDCTPAGKTRQQDLVINKFLWYDKDCLAKPSSCTEQDKIVAYETCGIMAKTGGCDSTEFLNDKSEYVEANRLCSDDGVEGLVAINARNCEPGTVADTIFQPTALGYGKQCRRCFSNDPTLAKVNGLYARLDPAQWDMEEGTGDEACDPGQEDELPASCYLPCDNIDPSAYFPAGFQDDATGTPNVCPATLRPGVTCFADADFFYADASRRSECDSAPYMEAKKKFANSNQSCIEVMDAYLTKFPDQPQDAPLSQVCPPDPFRYLDCNRADFSCNYTANTPSLDRFCKNDFSFCTDVEYLMDKAMQDAADDKCAQQVKNQEDFNSSRKQIPVYFSAVLGLLLLLLVGAMIFQGRAATKAAEKSSKFRRYREQRREQQFSKKVSSSFYGSGASTVGVGLIAILCLFIGVGLLIPLFGNNRQTVLGAILIGLGVLVVVVYLIGRWSYKRKVKKNKKDYIDTVI